MNSFEQQSQDYLKTRFHHHQSNTNTQQPQACDTTTIPSMSKSTNQKAHIINNSGSSSFQGFGLNVHDNDLVSSLVPPVTVVLEGRSICQRISLDKHGSYKSLALALRQMFVDDSTTLSEDDLDLSNAIPGYLIAYEDMENDLLLAGDLTWKDFVRVAKRIRILPVKGNTRKC
ncbi:unnamed protein product [Cochlearia groenlandica]